MWGKSNLKQFYVRQQQNAKKMKGYEYFRKALYISIQLFFSVLAAFETYKHDFSVLAQGVQHVLQFILYIQNSEISII